MSRPLQKLIPLEVLESDESENVKDLQLIEKGGTESEFASDPSAEVSPSDVGNKSPKIRRACAITGELIRRTTNQN